MKIENKIACVWATTFDDALIWEERNVEPSVYMHRIATDSKYRGRNLVVEIVKWAKRFAKENNKEYIRIDTVGENQGLIEYYQKCGFTFLGLKKITNTKGLPKHYENGTLCMFEIKLKQK